MVKDINEVINALEFIGKQFGVIHKSSPCKFDGENGFLIWDYILMNELTFVNARTNSYQSLFTSFSDEETEAEYNRLIKLSKKSLKREKIGDPLQEIKKLKELLDMDAITKKEYEKKKKELLSLI